MIWTVERQRRALAEGWLIAINSDHGERIERHDDAKRFDSDAAAQAYVAVRAMSGNDTAKAAWLYLAEHHGQIAIAAACMS